MDVERGLDQCKVSLSAEWSDEMNAPEVRRDARMQEGTAATRANKAEGPFQWLRLVRMNESKGSRGESGSLVERIDPAVVAQERSAECAHRGRLAHHSMQTRPAVKATTGMHPNDQDEQSKSFNSN